MTRRRLLMAGFVLVLVVASLRLAVTPTFIAGYELIDDYNIALQVIGAHPTWRVVTDLRESSTDVDIGISEIVLQFGPGFGDERIAYVNVTLNDPLGTRAVVDAATGSQIPRLAP
ncbi:MAG: hypothetical protein ACREMY_33425 [bacterium]